MGPNELAEEGLISCLFLVAIGLLWWGVIFRQKDAGVTFKPFRVLMLSHAIAFAGLVILFSALLIWCGLHRLNSMAILGTLVRSRGFTGFISGFLLLALVLACWMVARVPHRHRP
jgi:hypothetical protein